MYFFHFSNLLRSRDTVFLICLSCLTTLTLSSSDRSSYDFSVKPYSSLASLKKFLLCLSFSYLSFFAIPCSSNVSTPTVTPCPYIGFKYACHAHICILTCFLESYMKRVRYVYTNHLNFIRWPPYSSLSHVSPPHKLFY